MEHKLTLGEKLKLARKERKLTQAQLAGDSITRTMLSKVENNVAKPSLETIKYLANKLNKPISYFIDDDGLDQSNSKDIFLVTYEHTSFLMKNKENNKALDYLNKTFLAHDLNEKTSSFYKCKYLESFCLLSLGKYEKAKQSASNLIQQFLDEEDFYFASKSYFLIAACYFKQQKFNMSEKEVLEAIKLFKLSFIEDILYLLKLYYFLGYSQYKQFKYEKASNSFLSAISIAKENSCANKLGDIFMLLGIIKKRTGNIEEAIDYTNKAINYFSVFEQNNLVAMCRQNLGGYLFIVGNFKEALIEFNTALKYFIEEDNKVEISEIKASIVSIYISLKDFDKAIDMSKEVLEEHLSKVDRAEFFINMSKIQNHLKNFEKGKEFLSKSEELLADANDTLKMKATIYKEMADIYSKEGDYKKAFEFSNKANNIMI